jgi:hypothetical protein
MRGLCSFFFFFFFFFFYGSSARFRAETSPLPAFRDSWFFTRRRYQSIVIPAPWKARLPFSSAVCRSETVRHGWPHKQPGCHLYASLAYWSCNDSVDSVLPHSSCFETCQAMTVRCDSHTIYGGVQENKMGTRSGPYGAAHVTWLVSKCNLFSPWRVCSRGCYLLLVYSSCIRNINFILLSEPHASDVIHVAVTEIFRKIGANRFWLCFLCSSNFKHSYSNKCTENALMYRVYCEGNVHPITGH